jgi:hypothetical protein
MRHHLAKETTENPLRASPPPEDYGPRSWPHKLSERRDINAYHLKYADRFFLDAAQKIQQWRFNGEFGKRFKALCELQMWCFGCDIRRRSGNLLVDYGFTRSKNALKSYGTSHYSREFPCGFAIQLCGFAIIGTHRSATNSEPAILMRRFDSTPKLLPNLNQLSQPCTPHDLAHAFTPSGAAEYQDALTLFRKLTQELARYERHIEQVTESGYRSACISSAARRYRTVDSESLSSLWSNLSAS